MNIDATIALEKARCALVGASILLRNAQNNPGGDMSEVIGTEEGYTMAQVRLFDGEEDNVFYVTNAPNGKIAYYNPNDTSSPDNGTTILVDTDGRRYYLLTMLEIFNQLSKSWNIFDVI